MAFKLKSGNTTPFKQMGSSPAKSENKAYKPGTLYGPKGEHAKKMEGLNKKINNTLKNTTPKTNVKQAVKLNSQLAKNKQLGKKATKKIAGKIAGKVASRFLGPVGVALTLKDAYGTYKDVKKGKGIKESLKKNFLGIE